MKNNEATIFVFIASIIIGLLIAMNLGFEGKNNFLDVKQYNEAYNERSKLSSELNNIKQQYYTINSKFKKYNNSDSENKILEEIKKEVIYNNIILGNTDIEGQGVVITLEDGEPDPYDPNRTLIHDADILHVINDLENAGAEAVEVNGSRVIYDNYVMCNGVPITLNGIKIVPPFYISAIGNSDVMYNYLTLQKTQITSLKLRETKVNISKKDNIQILAYTGKYNYQYMKPLNEKD